MMSQGGRTAVPKFGSFRPKATPSSSYSKEATDKDRPSSRHRDRSPSHDRHRNRTSDRKRSGEHHRHHRSDHQDRGHGHLSSSRKQRSPSSEVKQDKFEESDLFIVDRRGDAKNVEFGSLHRYSIPAYHRPGAGAVKTSAEGRSKRTDRLLTAKSRELEPRSLRLVFQADTSIAAGEEEDFIPFRPSLKRKRASESPRPEGHGVGYRAIGDSLEAKDQPEDEDLEYASDSDAGEDPAELEARRVNAELNKKVKDDPSNLDAWAALIDHQTNLVRPGAEVAGLTNSEKRTLADIRLSIYDRALKHITRGKPGHEKLVLARLRECALIWESSKLFTAWNKILKENPNSTLLWTKYLDFVQTNQIHFRYENCKAAYIRCFKILDDAWRKAPPIERKDIATAKIYVLLRFTAFVRDAGYEELAYAVWQVILEYHFFKPPNLSGIEAELEALENFWESDVPRIGEEGAPAWDRFKGGDDGHVRNSIPLSTGSIDPKQPFASFSGLESEHLGTLLLPAATDDDSGTNDPFRFVMFSDLREVLECLLGHLPKSQLINGFLCFIGLPLLQGDDGSNAPEVSWRIDPFLSSSLLRHEREAECTAALLPEDCRHQNERTTTCSLFHGAFQEFNREKANSNDNGVSIFRFVDRGLDKLVSRQSDNDLLAEYYLAFKLEVFPEDVSRTAKRLLKNKPSSLRLYNAYALIEIRLGRLSKAEEVWSAALSMVPSLAEEAKDDAILVWHSWVLTFLHLGENAKALGCLLSIADGAPTTRPTKVTSGDVTAGQRLKTSRHFEEGFDRMRWKQRPGLAALHVECLAWLSYLMDDHALEPALGIYGKFSAKLTHSDDLPALELLHQAKARMLKLHMRQRRPYKPALLRSILAESIKLFPNNTMFLEVHTQVGAQSRLDDRLRDAVRAHTADREAFLPVRWLFSIAEEIRRCSIEGSGSTPNSVRSLFASALLSQDSEVKHSPALWRVWFRFESSYFTNGTLGAQSDDRLQKVKTVFYNGLRCLPWYKPWIVMGLKYFSRTTVVKKDELSRIYDVLTEREMRIRVEGVEGLD